MQLITTVRWLRLLAADRGISIDALARELRTPAALEDAIGAWIIARAHELARLHIVDRTEPDEPQDGSDLLARATWRCYRRLKAARDAQDNDEADAALERLMRRQRQQQEPQ